MQYTRFIALGDSMTEGMNDEVINGKYRGWADRVADGLAKNQPGFTYLNLDRTLKQSKHKTMVSFTRDKNFIPDGSIGNSGDGPRIKPDMLNVIFVADRSRLKSRYRVVPFDYGTIANKAWMDPVPRTRKNPEVEERVLTDRIYPLRQYITNIIYTGQDPEVQKKIDQYLSGVM